MAKLMITLKKSVIGSNEAVRETVKSLGLKKINSSVIQEDSPSVRGKIRKVEHLLSVDEITQ